MSAKYTEDIINPAHKATMDLAISIFFLKSGGLSDN